MKKYQFKLRKYEQIHKKIPQYIAPNIAQKILKNSKYSLTT